MTDQRVHRVASYIFSAGYEVTLIGRRFKNSGNPGLSGIKVRRFRLFFNKGFLFYASYNIRLFFFLLFRKGKIILVSNDLDTLPANFMAARLRRSKLVYDSHEYFTEVPELQGRNFVKNFWKFIEKLLVPGVDAAYTVNDSLAKMYSAKYGIDFGVVRNVPDSSLKEEDYQVPPDFREEGFLIYQGAVNKDRGLEELIDIISEERKFRLIIAGDGDVIEELKKTVSSQGISNFIRFTGKISPGELKTLTKNALLGLSIEKKTNLNYYYALPNKLFDYIRAGIPVLCSSFPEMRKIIDEYEVGKVVDPGNRDEIKKRILEMIDDEESRKCWINNTANASKELSWDIEQKRLVSIYKKVGIEL